jgi:hypothetical protein
MSRPGIFRGDKHGYLGAFAKSDSIGIAADVICGVPVENLLGTSDFQFDVGVYCSSMQEK